MLVMGLLSRLRDAEEVIRNARGLRSCYLYVLFSILEGARASTGL